MNYEQNNNGFNNNYDNNYNNFNNPNMLNNNMGNMNSNNNKESLSYHIKRFLIGFLLVAILIFVLLWLFPTKQNLKDAITEGFNPLYEKIFQENIDTMKEAAIAYYTTERLPKKEGDTEKLTLGEMLEMKLLLSIKDKNGEMCDTEDSYIEITKMDKEYKMKVNLSCGEEEDYIIVYLGCYNYCLNDICEKKEKTAIKEKAKPVPVAPKYYCAVVNGKYYNNNGKIVSKTSYKKACQKTAPKYYCAVVNGKYYDNKGKVVSKTAYKKACVKIPDKYKYLYKKTVTIHYDKKYSEWGPWSDKIAYNPATDNINWGTHEFVINEKLGYNTRTSYETDSTKPVWGTATIQTGSYTKYACAEYDYFVDSTTNTTYITQSGWVYQGTYVYSKVPSNSRDVKYVFAGVSYSDCGTVCSISPKYKFHKYTRTTTQTTATSNTESDLRVVCKTTVKKEIPIYSVVDQIVGYGVKETKEITYYYHKKERSLINNAYTKTRTYKLWSLSKNDKTLINQGYKYTGIKQKIK